MRELKNAVGNGRANNARVESSLKNFVRHTTAPEERDEGEDWEELLLHLLRSELELYTSSLSYLCTHEFCNGRFIDADSLRRHKEREHESYFQPFPFQCHICDSRHLCADFLDAHLRRVHGREKTPFDCTFPGCSRKFSVSNSLRGHMNRHHKGANLEAPSNRRAAMSGYRDKSVMGLVTSKKILGRKKEASSVYCQEEGCTYRAWKGTRNMEFHQKSVHEKSKKAFACTECEKLFSNKESLRVHFLSKHKSDHERFKCEYCPKEFVIRAMLNGHMRKAHAGNDTIRKCSTCERNCFPQEILRHERCHTNKTGFNCVLKGCDEPHYETLQDLRNHVSTSHDAPNREHICEICGSICKSRPRLKRHMLCHTVEKPYKCTICDRRFKNPGAKKTHEEISHPVGGRIYACTLCEKTFSVAQYLYKHTAWHKYGSNACRPVAKKKPNPSWTRTKTAPTLPPAAPREEESREAEN